MLKLAALLLFWLIVWLRWMIPPPSSGQYVQRGEQPGLRLLITGLNQKAIHQGPARFSGGGRFRPAPLRNKNCAFRQGKLIWVLSCIPAPPNVIPASAGITMLVSPVIELRKKLVVTS